MFYKERCFKNSEKYTGEHLCRSLFFSKVAGPRQHILREHLWVIASEKKKKKGFSKKKWKKKKHFLKNENFVDAKRNK